jgi:hypothetical protein
MWCGKRGDEMVAPSIYSEAGRFELCGWIMVADKFSQLSNPTPRAEKMLMLTQDVKSKEKTKKPSLEMKSDADMEGRLENMTLEDIKMEES